MFRDPKFEKMNTDPSNVPIITLAGVSSITDLLSELPFPAPPPRKQSLLHTTWLSSESQKTLNNNNNNPNLVQEILQVLRITNSDHVDAGEMAGNDPVASPNAPELLRLVVLNDVNIFKTRPSFNNGNNNSGYALLGHNELYPTNQRTLEEGAYNTMQSSVNGPCLPYEHQQVPMQGHPYQTQDFEYLMNGINPAIMQQMAANQGAGALLMGGAMLQASNQLRAGELNHFPGGLIAAQYPNQSANHPLIGNFMNNIQSGGGGSFKIAGTPPSGLSKNNNKSFVATNESYYSHRPHPASNYSCHPQTESSPAQASSAPPAGAEPIIRMGNTSFDQSLPPSPYSGTGYFQPQSFPMSPLMQNQQQFARQTQQQQTFQQQQQHDLYQQQHPDHMTLSNVKVVLEPLHLDSHMTSSLKKSSPDPSCKMSNELLPRVSLTRLDEKKDKSLGSVMQYNVVHDPTQNLKIKFSKKGVKRRHSDEDEDDESNFSSSLTERVKRRKRSASGFVADDNEDDSRHGTFDNSDLSSGPSSVSEVSRRREEKKKKKHHHHNHRSVPNDALDDELVEGATVRKFYNLIEQVIEMAEEIDLSALKDDDDENSGFNEIIITKQLLMEVVSEAAKLKTVANMNQVPYEKLIKLLTLLQFSIKQGLRNVPLNDVDEAGDDLFRELTMEHVTCGLDACLAAMLVMTSKDMPKQVFIEDVIDKVVRFTKNHLRNFIYPVFDPVYRVDPSGKGGQSSMKVKRSKASMTSMKDRTILSIYNKLTDVTSLLAELVDIQDLTDTIVLQMSSLSVSPFFVENIPELQLNALKLVTNIFSKYEKHRQLILEDILSSLARLPSSKKNLRSYRLNVNENIQMVTALALQLIQCVVKLPSNQDEGVEPDDDNGAEDVARRSKRSNVDKEVVILSSYETAMTTAHNFLHVFLGKCSAKEEDNYRSLFGNFVNDLLSTVNKPEWPAAELLLSLLGHLLVRQFSCKSVEMSLRVASLDYLGIVAARLRKDAVSSHTNEATLDDIVSRVMEKEDELRQMSLKVSLDDSDEEIIECDKTSPKKSDKSEISRTESLQKALLEYLAANTGGDPALTFARRFYVAQWMRDCSKEIETKTKKMSDERRNSSRTSTPKKQHKNSGSKKPKKAKPRNSRRLVDSDDDETDSEETEEEEEDEETKLVQKMSSEMELLKITQMEIEKRKQFLLKEAASFKTFTSSIKQTKSRLDYDSALLITRYLASNRPFSHSFDIYLTQILKVLNDTAVAVRSRALKCLAAVVEADPGVLARKDMKGAVHTRFIDSSTSVREAAIELVGKFILIRPELTAQYYDMLSERILDTGISVRKRVIKIFRDICLEQPNFPKVPEMCVKMVRRVNDEEGIRKLVNETFQNMWFTPCRDKDTSSLLQKVLNITEVASIASTSIGFEWLERLMDNLLKAEEEAKEKPVFKSCRQIVDCLVDNMLQLESNADVGTSNSRLVACFSTLYLFCKVQPNLLVKHCTLIHPYLNLKFMTRSEMLIASNVVKILELSVPLMEHPGESFLAQLEEDISKLVLKLGPMIIQSGISCLGAIVRDITHNYKLILDCFNKFYGIANRARDHFGIMVESAKQCLRRSLFVVGHLCKQFDLDSKEFEEYREMSCMKEKVFELLLHFLGFADVKQAALVALGCLTTRYYELMLGKELRDIYHKMLTDPTVESNMCCQVLNNIKEYLIEEEVKMAKADAEWRKLHDKENLKEMGDVQSGMASTIIQIYLKQILESFFHLDSQVRMAALEVVSLILNQGLVHPQQCMAQLICMGSDPNINIRLKADKQILEIDKKYPGFVQARAMQGIKMSCRLQRLLHQSENQQSGQLRGVRVDESGSLISLNSYIYSLVRGNRSNRRVVVMNALRMFEDKTPLEELLYMADNLAYFHYQLQDEPLFVIHQIDIILSVSGFNLLQSFRECFYPPPTTTTTGLENGTASIKLEGDDDKKMVKNLEGTMDCSEEMMTVKEEPKVEVKEMKNESSLATDHHRHHPTSEHPRYDEDDDDDDDPETLLALIPVEGDTLAELYMSLQGYILLLVLKQHLKDMYGFTDNKIQQYTPMDFKAYEKSVNRKHGVKFQPNQTLELLARSEPLCQRNADHRREIVSSYLNFKELMASIDKEDMDDDTSPTATNNNNNQESANTSLSGSSNGPMQSNSKRPANQSGKSRKPSSNRSTHQSSSSSSSKKVKKKAKRRKNVCSNSEDEDDDDCDDDNDVDWQ